MKNPGFFEETDLKSMDLDVLLKMTIECIREIQCRKSQIHDFINKLDKDIVELLESKELPESSDS